MKKIILIVLLLLAIGFAVKTSWMYSKGVKSGTPIAAVASSTMLTRNLTFGDYDPEVGILQNFLVSKGFLDSYMYSLNGFGTSTLNAVKSFQMAYGIEPVDGSVNAITRAVINSQLGTNTSVPTRLTLDLSENINSSNPEVLLLENFLIETGWATSTYEQTGIFNAMTKSAVIGLQTDFGISPANGFVGESTREVVNRLLSAGPLRKVKSFSVNPTSKLNIYEVSYVLRNTDASSGVGVNASCPPGITIQRMDNTGKLTPFLCGDWGGPNGPNGSFGYDTDNFNLVFTNSTSKKITTNVFISAINMRGESRDVVVFPKGTVVPPQPEPSCKSVKSSGFKIDPSSYTVTMIDKKGDKDFNVSLVPNNSCVKYKYTVDTTGDLASAIKGTTQGTATGKTTIKKSLSDSKLSVANPRMGSTVYKGQLKVTIVSTTNSADKVTLTQNITVTVKMK